MKNYLVTGGAGFIGSGMAEKLAADTNIKVVIVDNFVTGLTEKLPDLNLYPNVRFIKCDVNNYEDIASVFYAYKFEYVFHYAALVGVKRTLQNPVAVLEDVKGLENILRLSKNTNVKRVFYSSSSEVYGEPVEFPQNENTTPLNSRLPYAVVKNLGESFKRTCCNTFVPGGGRLALRGRFNSTTERFAQGVAVSEDRLVLIFCFCKVAMVYWR